MNKRVQKSKSGKPAAKRKRSAAKQHENNKNPGFWELIKTTVNTLIDNYRLIGAISVVYGILYFLFSNGVSILDISELRNDLQETFNVDPETVGGRFLLAGLVFQTASSLDQVGATYMLFASLVTILALIWILRHIWAKKKTTIKEAFYKGMYPIIPFTLLFLMAVLQLLPLIIGSTLLDTALSNEILNGAVETSVGVILLLILPALWSAKMLVRTLFAMLIVTIPDMTPMEAYASAKDLLKHRQLYAIRQFLILGFSVLVFLAVFLVIFVAIMPSLSVILSFLFNVIMLPLGVTFIYVMYRKLL